MGDIVNFCSNLESHLVTKRKVSCEGFAEFISRQDVINSLNNSSFTWNSFFDSLKTCLEKDSTKLDDDIRKKPKTLFQTPISSDAFYNFVNTGLKEGSNLSVSNVIDYILRCLKIERMQRCYEKTYLTTLIDAVLGNMKIVGQIENKQWIILYELVKTRCIDNETSCFQLYVKCLALIIKHGPLSGLPFKQIRQEHIFFIKFSKKFECDEFREQRDDLLNILCSLYWHTAKDFRASCCHLGEETVIRLSHFINMNNYDCKINRLILEYFFLQIQIHHPNGAEQFSKTAYAYDWDQWQKCLKTIYTTLNNIIEYITKYKHNTTKFAHKRGNVTVLDNIVDLFVEVSNQMLLNNNSTYFNDEQAPPSKKQKLNISIGNYIEAIEETKSFLWITLVSSLLKSYPNLINETDYLHLLQILSLIQLENKDSDVLNATYNCLAILCDIKLKQTVEIENMWKNVCETTLRSTGSTIDSRQLLLKKLLISNKVMDSEQVFHNYVSCLMNFSEQSIETLEILLDNMNLLKAADVKKQILVNMVLNKIRLSDANCLCSPTVAKILVGLLLTQWPKMDDKKIVYKESLYTKLDEIKDVYLKTLLVKNLKPKTNLPIKHTAGNDSFCLNPHLNTFLENALQEIFYKCESQSPDILLNFGVLLINIVGLLVESHVISMHDLNDITYTKLLKNILHSDKLLDILNNCKLDEHFYNVLKAMERLFSINDRLSTYIREMVTHDLIKALFCVRLHYVELCDRNKTVLTQLQTNIMKKTIYNLSYFCLMSSTNSLLKVQEQALEILCDCEFSCKSDIGYTMIICMFKCLSCCKIGVLPDVILENFIDLLRQLCEERYKCYENVVDILKIVHDIIPHVGLSTVNKNNIVNLLYPFYIKKCDYGPQVSILILKCIKQLFLIDPDCQYSIWNSEENIFEKVPLFLCHDNQEVRFIAIELLIDIFQYSEKKFDLTKYHDLEIMFDTIYDMCFKLFEVNGELTDCRQIDEISTRTSSVLQTFTGIILNCSMWIEESLFALVKLYYHKKLDKEPLNDVLKKISKHFYIENEVEVLNKHLEYMVNKWVNCGFPFDKFPFDLLGCIDINEFYLKYPDICMAIILEKNSLMESDLRIDLEKICAKMFVRALHNDIDLLKNDLISESKIISYLIENISEDKLKKNLLDRLDDILVNLLNLVTDDNYIQEHFNETIIFYRKNLSYSQFQDCLQFIEKFLLDGNEIIQYLNKNCKNKVANILLHLQLKFSESISFIDKLKYFQHYTIFSNMILENLNNTTTNWQIFFTRQSIYSLIHLIEDNMTVCEEIDVLILKYLKQFIKNILPEYKDILETFLRFITNSLNNIVLKMHKNEAIKQHCLEILSFLIIENGHLLRNVIKKLQDFPHQSYYDSIRKVYKEIKYGNGLVTLEEEIKYFLEIDESLSNNCSLQDSLKHLKNILNQEKDQLYALYDDLKEIKGFSEDCQKSLLHHLICVLVKLTASSVEQVSFEAMRCLGELGPGNLMTLVLQPEKEIVNVKCSTSELLTGHIVSHLTEYIVDQDISVRSAASKALYAVLNSKEGKKVATSSLDFGYGIINKSYLTPFLAPARQMPSTNFSVRLDVFNSNVAKNELWSPHDNKTHKEWATNLMVNLLQIFTDNCFLYQLIRICELKLDFCENILPVLINFLILYINDKYVIDVLTKQIQYFFEEHITRFADSFVVTNKRSVQCMLNVVNFVRLQIASSTKCKLNDLNLNYLYIAHAAEFCDAHFSALFYAELWCRSHQHNTSSFMEQKSLLDCIYEEIDEQTGTSLRNILKNAYKAIGDVDSLAGCGVSPQILNSFNVDHYKDLNQWQLVLYLSDMQHSIGSTSINSLRDSLKLCGLYNVVHELNPKEPDYECMWRLSQWTYTENNITRSQQTTVDQYDKFKYFTLKAIHDSDNHMFNKMKTSQSLCILNDLRQTSLECSKNFYGILMRLQSLIELEDFSYSIQTSSISDLLLKWKKQQLIISSNDFQYIEPIISQRIVMLNDYINRYSIKDDLKMSLVDMALNLVELARNEKRPQVAMRTLCFLQNIDDVNGFVKSKIQLQAAQNCWSVNDKSTAQYILSKLCKDENIEPNIRAAALKLSGQWMIDTMSGDRLIIIKEYLLKSLKMIRDQPNANTNNILDTYDILALFVDKEYQQIMTLIKSDHFQRKKTNMAMSKQTAQSIAKQSVRTDDQRRAGLIHEKQSNIDQSEIEHTHKMKNDFLYLALKYYIRNITQSDKTNNRIFRIMSLFLENRRNETIYDLIKDNLHTIPTYKFITMLPQIIPHIAETDFFGQQVNSIVKRCAIDHPHHTLPLILSLVNANADQKYTKAKNVSQSNDARIRSAEHMLTSLKTHHSLCEYIEKLQFLSEALIELAYHPIARDRQNSIPKTMKVMRIKNFDNVLVPTCNLPVNKAKNYADIIGIHSFAPVYYCVGGVNVPKRITCHGTNGKEYCQLVKGQDDLRQDAVMQQVFSIMNNLLWSNKQTKSLSIRTYKIVPLSRRSGILEWVENSMELGRYLLEAHSKYYPNDFSASKCRSIYSTSAKKDQEEKKKTFETICKSLNPVMHKFFEELFPHPTVWYERRRAYIHSVATASMCGYILGIGDRHINNILIDKTTAEVIHIDFGIAFEQGRLLPTPETVPFRLTRDVVDGMGVSGVEGAFRKSCEKTMEILRQNGQTITTILEVLLYDPLYVWTVSSSEANKRQNKKEKTIFEDSEVDEESDTVNNTADRALLRLRDKLQGTEDGSPATIEFQVTKLISQAMDVNNLCRMFYGWQPYL